MKLEKNLSKSFPSTGIERLRCIQQKKNEFLMFSCLRNLFLSFYCFWLCYYLFI